MSQQKHQPPSLSRSQARSYGFALLQIVSDVLSSGKPADRILSAYFKANKQLGARDRRAVMESLFSVFRWWGWLKHLVVSEELILNHKIKESDWTCILLAAHALDNDEFPPFALGWKETAGLTADIPAMSGLSLTEKAESFSQTFDTPECNITALVPAWACDEIALADNDMTRLIESFCKRPPMWIRIQRNNVQHVVDQLTEEGLSPSLLKGTHAINLGNPRINLYHLESFKKGAFEVQDLASQFIGEVCDAKPGQRWWDCCAGAGGKTLQLASLMNNKGTVVASDIREYKLKDLKKRARRAGFSNISPKPWPSNKIPVKAATFDGVLVDAPCSCSGTWRRNPDARWTSSPDEPATLSVIQLDILKRASKAVKPGGVLTYATCSFCKKENDDVVNGFLEQFPDFTLEAFAHPVTGTIQESGKLQTLPWDYDSDAMFVAKMRRSK